MNTIVTSREEIIAASLGLIQQQGWKSVNIRSVAKACGVSVGSIYNYFDSKAELLTAAIGSVWKEIFHLPEEGGKFGCFLDYIRWIFQRMEEGGKKYPGFFTLHSMSFLGEDLPAGKLQMARSWEHIQQEMARILEDDPQVRPGAFDGAITPASFSGIVFSLILSAVARGQYRCDAILEMIRRTLY